MAQMGKNPSVMQETWVWSLCWEDSLEKGMATDSSILVGESPWTKEPTVHRFKSVTHDLASSHHNLSMYWGSFFHAIIWTGSPVVLGSTIFFCSWGFLKLEHRHLFSFMLFCQQCKNELTLNLLQFVRCSGGVSFLFFFFWPALSNSEITPRTPGRELLLTSTFLSNQNPSLREHWVYIYTGKLTLLWLIATKLMGSSQNCLAFLLSSLGRLLSPSLWNSHFKFYKLYSKTPYFTLTLSR